MVDQALQIALTGQGGSESAERRFVHLTQPVENEMAKTASMSDISAMIALARSGQTARNYKKPTCPADITDKGVKVRLDFEAWPSKPNLAYTLTSSIGQVSTPEIIEEYTEFSLIFGRTDVVELDFILSEINSYSWETRCYTPKGQPVSNPAITMDGLTTVRADKVIFGVVRIKGRKIGARHVVTHELLTSYPVRPDTPLPEEGVSLEDLETYWAYTDVDTWNGVPVDENDTVDMTGLQIENLQITITAKWKNIEGEEETESMRLNIPQCVKDLLNPCNPDESGGDSVTNICPDTEPPLHVYFSGCTGKVLLEIPGEEDENGWCK